MVHHGTTRVIWCVGRMDPLYESTSGGSASLANQIMEGQQSGSREIKLNRNEHAVLYDMLNGIVRIETFDYAGFESV